MNEVSDVYGGVIERSSYNNPSTTCFTRKRCSIVCNPAPRIHDSLSYYSADKGIAQDCKEILAVLYLLYDIKLL